MPKSDLKSLKANVDSAAKEQAAAAKERSKIITQLDEANEKLNKATEKLDEATMAHVKARTGSFNVKLVSKARDLGINPDNFETVAELKTAVETVEKGD